MSGFSIRRPGEFNLGINRNWGEIESSHSALAIANERERIAEMRRQDMDYLRKEAERKQKAEEAAIELNQITKQQNELLREQNEQLMENAKSDKIWKWVSTILAVLGLIGTILGIIF